MPNDLSAEFEQGRLSYLENHAPDSCPHYATSDCADAWHAGRAFEAVRPTDFDLGKVEHGRGYAVNVYPAKGSKGRFRKLVYTVEWARDGAVTVRRDWQQ